ncbi:hypothetical protein, partial [Thiolapillus sp.]
DWTPRSEAYFVFPLAQGTPGKQCGLAATGVYQPSLRSPWLVAIAVYQQFISDYNMRLKNDSVCRRQRTNIVRVPDARWQTNFPEVAQIRCHCGTPNCITIETLPNSNQSCQVTAFFEFVRAVGSHCHNPA